MKRIFTCIVAGFISALSCYSQSFVADSVEPGMCQASFSYFTLDKPFENGVGYQFIDNSWSNVMSWHWDFGDGTTSSEPQPVHYYMYAGDTVQVCLTITSPNNCTSSVCEKFVVGEGQYSECPVTFDILVMESFPPQYRLTPSRKDSLATYYWDFGDGTWSYEIEPTHTYDYSGTYSVCLSYMSPEGCTAYVCDTLKAQGYDADCKASFIAYGSGFNYRNYPSPDTLNGPNGYYSFLDQSKGDVIKWRWDFGDSTFSDERNPVHQFSEPGIYTVCLEILTSDGCTSTYCEEVYFQNSFCSYTGTVKDYTGLDGCGLVIELDNGIVIEPVEIVPNFILRDGQRVMLGYTELNDRASICMAGVIARIDCIQEIQDDCFVSFYFYELPWVSSVPPIYKFVIDSGFAIAEVVWDFGDGTATNEYSPEHRFQNDGYYNVCLKVVYFDGCTASYCQTSWFDGYDPQPGLCDNYIRLTTDFILNGQTCNGTAAAGLVNTAGQPVSVSEFLWSTGETTPQINNLCPGYTYSVTVVDETGCAVSGSFAIGSPFVYPDSLIGYWNYQQDNMDFVFNLPVYSDSLRCEWDFGDGATATGSVVNHTFATPEKRSVEINVFDNSGNIIYTGQIMISPGSPTSTGITEYDPPSVYPVPAKDVIFVEFSGQNNISSIEIMNAAGRVLNVKTNIYNSGNIAEVNISGISPGFYIGKAVIEKEGIRTFKFIKE